MSNHDDVRLPVDSFGGKLPGFPPDTPHFHLPGRDYEMEKHAKAVLEENQKLAQQLNQANASLADLHLEIDEIKRHYDAKLAPLLEPAREPNPGLQRTVDRLNDALELSVREGMLAMAERDKYYLLIGIQHTALSNLENDAGQMPASAWELVQSALTAHDAVMKVGP
jgi:hypothetical protein